MNRDIFCKLNDLKEFNPIFLKDEIIIDNMDEKYLIRNAMSISLYANEMALNILLMCNGENTIENIIEIINKQYEISKEEIKIDVLEILHMAWKKHFLEWKSRNVFKGLYEKMYINGTIFSRVFSDGIVNVIDNDSGITNLEINEKTWYKPQTIQGTYNNDVEFCYCIKKNNKIEGGITLYPDNQADLENNYISRFKINFIDMKKIEKNEWENFIRWCIFNFFQTENYISSYSKVFLEIETSSYNLIMQEMVRLGFRNATLDKKSNYQFWDKEVVF